MTPISKQLLSGRVFVIGGPKQQLISIRDIAGQLAKICRFSGATQQFYSVAQHSVLVADILCSNPKVALYGLLHDAHQIIIGDITSTKKALLQFGAGDALLNLQNHCDEIIYNSFGLPYPAQADVHTCIKRADLIALATERRDLMAESSIDWGALPDAHSKVIKPWAWPKAEEMFLKKYDDLSAMSGASIRVA